MKRILLFVFVASLMSSCKESSDKVAIGSYIISPHFISAYLMPAKIEALSNAPGHLYLKVTGDVYRTMVDKDSKNYDIVQYLSNLYGDTFFNQASASSHNALAYPIEKITIYCGKDFDAEHPAGEPLDDIVKLNYQSYYEFVESGYTAYKYDNPDWISPTADHYVLNFNKVTADVSKLVMVSLADDGSLAGVEFDSSPSTPGEYPFTIEMVVNGETLTTDFIFNFE